VLNLSNLGLTGLLQEDRPLSDDMSRLASDLTQLRILNISGNPGMSALFISLRRMLNTIPQLFTEHQQQPRNILTDVFLVY
jgi:hypothetical protein